MDLYESPKTLNPDIRWDETSLRIATVGMFEHLVEVQAPYQDRVKILPALAKSWQVSPDARIFTFQLSPNVKWQDGKPFTSQDVKWTFEQIVKEKGGAYDYVKDIDRIEVPDDLTVRVTLKEPNASFLTSMGMYYGPYILPKHLYEGSDWTTNPYNERPVGTGPFKFKEWVKDSRIVLEANPTYHLGRPKIDQVVLRIIPDLAISMAGLERGETHYLFNYPPLRQVQHWRDNPSLGVQAEPVIVPITIWMAFNLKRKPFDDVRVRKAIAYAVDRQDVNKRVYMGYAKAADGIFPSTAMFYDLTAKQPPFDPTAAAKLLDEAGLKPGANGVRFQMTATTTNVQQTFDIATVMKADLQKLGIDVSVQLLDWPTFQEKTIAKRDFDVAFSGGFRGPDPQESYKYFGSTGYRNQMSYSNPAVDELYKKGVSTSATLQRRQFYSRLQHVVAADLPSLNFVEFPFVMAARKGFSGWFWEPGSQAGFFQFRNVSRKQP